MSIKYIIPPDFSAQDNISPRVIRIFSTDNYATITSQNYLSNKNTGQFNYSVLPSDFIFIYYSSNAFGIFTPSISGSSVTLIPLVNPGNISFSGSSVVGNFPKFSDTSGNQVDSLVSTSDPTKSKVASVNSATVNGNFSMFSDTNGTVSDTGITATIFSLTGSGGSASNNVVLTRINPASSILMLSQVSSANSQPLIGYSLPSSNTITLVWPSNPGAFVVNALVKF